MQKYVLTIERTIKVIAHVHIDGENEADAVQRFQHQLESEQCSPIEDEEMWGEILYYQATKAGPYASTYEVLDANPSED
jgi:hypothetical protein